MRKREPLGFCIKGFGSQFRIWEGTWLLNSFSQVLIKPLKINTSSLYANWASLTLDKFSSCVNVISIAVVDSSPIPKCFLHNSPLAPICLDLL